MANHRRKDPAASRRRVEDEGEEEGSPDLGDLDDDSLSEGSIISDENDAIEGDEANIIESASTASPELFKVNGNGSTQQKANGSNSISPPTSKSLTNGTNDMDMMLNGLQLEDQDGTAEDINYEDLREDDDFLAPSPAVVTSTTQMDRPQELPHERRRREHEEYKKKRDADPAFVPNRGAFFMHDHRHAGPAANGFRPFGRGRGRGRPGVGGPFVPVHIPQSFEPTDAPWAHDMHEVITEPIRNGDGSSYTNGFNTSGRIPLAPKTIPPNRSLSTTKQIGNVQIRVSFSTMEKPIVFPGIPVKQYTRLPDHRPPLRRDKPVRISLPDNPPRYIFPSTDRSFIFIPRAMRPNQQGFGSRGRGRSGIGSIGGFSRRTSVFGGSMYGSAYSPSVAMSRRSSLAREVNRESIISPTGSTISRAQVPDASRPIVKLPPSNQPQPNHSHPAETEPQNGVEPPVEDQPRPVNYPLPQKPTFRENRPNPIPMHQPRPQKTVSVADIESPASLSFNPPQQHQQPFHQQVPIQVNGNNYFQNGMLHSRNASYPSQASTGTPLSQIPERAIHAQPFQPNPYQQTQNFYPQQPFVPQSSGYYYPQNFDGPMVSTASAAPFIPAQQQPQQPQQSSYSQPPDSQSDNSASNVQNLVAQEVNGMVYYYDAAQIPAVATFSAYQPQPYPMQQVGGVVGMGGMMTPSPDGFYYPQAPQGVVYYPQ
ncbi:hypothetical protein B7494_g2253 [Chlorociboria aeruginascens]|nr:hypothetical protein B7494_g2253 [Chlorociboria aeruginascens]